MLLYRYIIIAYIFRVICSSKNFQKSMWILTKYAINSLLHFVNIFSEKGLEFVGKVLSHSYMSIENHGKGNDIFHIRLFRSVTQIINHIYILH